MYAVEADSFDISAAVMVSVMVVVMPYFLPAVSQVLEFGVRMRARYGISPGDVDVSDF